MDPSLVQACQLTWSEDLRISSVRGDPDCVFHKARSELEGRPLHEVLEVTLPRARALDLKARQGGGAEFLPVRVGEESTVLRLWLGTVEGRASAAVMDAHAFLNGAPPLQISRLASSLSHEIRNPLSSVKMAVQTLARNPSHSERDQRRLAIANREIRTMERMLGLLSEYGREAALHLELIPLRSLLQDALSMVEPELSERGIKVAFDEPSGVPRVKVDSHRLRLVLAQFLLNVAMGLPQGAELTVRLSEAAGGCALSIEDPAAAVPAEERATLFEPFGSRLARGAGLSLAALRRVVQAQGGDVGVESLGDAGALFTLTFPGG